MWPSGEIVGSMRRWGRAIEQVTTGVGLFGSVGIRRMVATPRASPVRRNLKAPGRPVAVKSVSG